MAKAPVLDRRERPTIRREWLGWWPRRYGAYWWKVGCLVKRKRVRHRNKEDIMAICALVDTYWPEHMVVPPPRPDPGSSLPEYGPGR